jgi:hypothetical protein
MLALIAIANELVSEAKTIRNYRDPVRHCEDLAEYALGEQIRGILIEKQIRQTAYYLRVKLEHFRGE